MLKKVISRGITVKNKQLSLTHQFLQSFQHAQKTMRIVDYSYEKASRYKGEFNEYALPFDRSLDECRHKQVDKERRELRKL